MSFQQVKGPSTVAVKPLEVSLTALVRITVARAAATSPPKCDPPPWSTTRRRGCPSASFPRWPAPPGSDTSPASVGSSARGQLARILFHIFIIDPSIFFHFLSPVLCPLSVSIKFIDRFLISDNIKMVDRLGMKDRLWKLGHRAPNKNLKAAWNSEENLSMVITRHPFSRLGKGN